MVKINKHKKLLVAILVILGTTLGIYLALRLDASIVENYRQGTESIGLERAKVECEKEGLLKPQCASVHGTSEEVTECMGEPCWIFHANTEDPSVFSADITVGYKDGKAYVIDYFRGSVER